MMSKRHQGSTLYKLCSQRHGGTVIIVGVDSGIFSFVLCCRKRRRSWYSLLGTAITYVWPDSTILQLRAFTCIVLILIMRVLNLAVPILYKKVVDTLASTSEGTHPRPGEEREYYQFWQVRCHTMHQALAGIARGVGPAPRLHSQGRCHPRGCPVITLG